MDKQGLPSPGSIGEQDIYLFLEGTHGRLYRRLGCQLGEAVAVIGDFNGWRRDAHPARPRGDASGLWEAEVPGVAPGQRYKFAIRTRGGEWLEKADPYARRCEAQPATA